MICWIERASRSRQYDALGRQRPFQIWEGGIQLVAVVGGRDVGRNVVKPNQQVVIETMSLQAYQECRSVLS